MVDVTNGANSPPHLPDHPTRSTIRTRSSNASGRAGTGFHELYFEDLEHSEEISLHAEKDLNERVLSDHTTHVGHDQSNRVKHDHYEGVDAMKFTSLPGPWATTTEERIIGEVHKLDPARIVTSGDGSDALPSAILRSVRSS